MTRLNFEQFVSLRLLLNVEGIGPGKIRNLLAQFKSLNSILSASHNELTKTDQINKILAQRIRQASLTRDIFRKKIKEEIERLSQMGASVITVWDPEYPPLLKKIYDPPLILYALGSFTEADNYSVAIVGTRQPSNYGKVQAEKFSSDLCSQGVTVVSGMARGIDSIVHRSAIKIGGRTIAVIGSGLDVIYPPENRQLFSEIIRNGVVLTEFELGTKPDAQNFPRRNRIISGISLGSIIVESGVSGGAMQTAAFALEQNREVFAVPGNLGVRQSEGTNALIQRSGAKLVCTVDDVIQELEIKLKPVIGKNIPKAEEELNMFEEKLMACLDNEPKQIDLISSMSSLSTSDCLVYLLSLEFKGLVRQYPGKMFSTA
ncbi:MAG: DNA-protecting protein DprA [Ignavibacteria bacterium]|nr:DNA-protecting protein DprA [Ignavibacteria bacterium]MCU7503674.1 DNA-protecting protein DprA [Ignavibacteria bacterium]MCU7518485.1 DNA-protecting protein DprA [Ignavibacteria bacterium]